MSTPRASLLGLLLAIAASNANAQLEQLIKAGETAAVTQAENTILADVAEAAGVGAPILLDQTKSFPEVPVITDFHPRHLAPRNMADLLMPLPAGDYSMEVRGYCTRATMHAPSLGTGYKLAHLMGKQSPAVGAILVRGELAGVSPWILQGIVWNIEAGQPLQDMSPDQQALVHKLIPDYEQGLKEDFLAELDEKYEKYRTLVPSLPTLDQILAKSPQGQYLLNLKHQREMLKDRTISAENQADRIYQPTGDGLPRVLPVPEVLEPSPWSQVRPGIYARLTVQQGYAGKNLLEFRITAEAFSSPHTSLPKHGSTLMFASAAVGAAALPGVEILPSGGELVGACVAAPEVCVPAIVLVGAAGYIIAYPISRPAQPLTLAPVLQTEGMAADPPRVPVQTAQGVRHATTDCDTEDKRREFQAAKDAACGLPRSCQETKFKKLSPADIDARLANGMECLLLREQIQMFCYAPGDNGYDAHTSDPNNPIDDIWDNIKTCWEKKFSQGR
jgi:hypothetical protein